MTPLPDTITQKPKLDGNSISEIIDLDVEHWTYNDKCDAKNHIEKLLELVAVLESSLAILVAAKDEKDDNGESERYHILKRDAWDNARNSLLAVEPIKHILKDK